MGSSDEPYYQRSEDPTENIENNIENMSNDNNVKSLAREFMLKTDPYYYSYNFKWLGRPIIQFPQDIMAMQEIIWETNPDIIIETGIAHGGSLIFSASLLELIGGDGFVIGIDINIREKNKKKIMEHPMNKRIKMIEGSSISEEVVNEVKSLIESNKKIMVILDSNHTHHHVLEELKLYSPFVTKGCYLIVFDTFVEDMPEDFVKNRPWSKGDNPKTAVWEFLKSNERFLIDKEVENKLLISVAPDGYLKCIKD